MKKFLILYILSLFVGSVVFAQDFDSEADDLIELQNNKKEVTQNEYFIGFDVSFLGIEPTFQMIRNEHFEFQTGISFIQYGYNFIAINTDKTGVITPMVDVGYRTNFFAPKSNFSIGATAAIPLAIEKNSFSVAGALAIYFKLSKTLGIFELGGKTYVPLLLAYTSTSDEIGKEVIPAFAQWPYILGGLAFTTFEVKIHIK